MRAGFRLTLPLLLMTILSLPARAQGPVLFQGARVQVTAPVFGTEWLPGQVATARLRGRECLGVALDRRDPAGNPVFVLRRGILALKVDRRTNTDVRIAVTLPEAADSDWVSIPPAALAAQDSSCAAPVPPAPR